MSESNANQHVCVIGLGDMGSAIAQALLAQGYRVAVWNRTASKCGPLAEAGATLADSLPGAATGAQWVVVCVLDHAATLSLLMPDGVAGALRGKLLVQLSTVTADESRALVRWAGENGIDYLDGSILGYRQDMLGARCPVVYSGSKALFDANAGVLSAIGGSPRLVSETVGGAVTFDKAFYSFHWGSLLAFFHGAALCHAAGFPTELYTELLLGQAGDNTRDALRRYGEMIAKRSYKAEAIEVDVMAYAHVTALSEDLGIDTAYPRVVARYLDRARSRGEQSLASIFEAMIERAA